MSEYYQANQEQQQYAQQTIEQPQGHPKPILAIRDVTKSYHQGTREIQVLNSISADIFKGEAIALVGPSGSGKSSLLHILGMLDKADSGKVYLNGQDCTNFNDAERTAIRKSDIGFVYQFHQLLPEFSALENVVIPQLINGHSQKEAMARAKVILEFLGLQERLGHRPNAMSGGEQQRVAIARAIANEPTLLLADEPTGNLDPNTAERVFQSLIGLIRQTGLAAIIATHNLELASRMDRVLQMQEGKLYSYIPQQQQGTGEL